MAVPPDGSKVLGRGKGEEPGKRKERRVRGAGVLAWHVIWSISPITQIAPDAMDKGGGRELGRGGGVRRSFPSKSSIPHASLLSFPGRRQSKARRKRKGLEEKEEEERGGKKKKKNPKLASLRISSSILSMPRPSGGRKVLRRGGRGGKKGKASARPALLSSSAQNHQLYRVKSALEWKGEEKKKLCKKEREGKGEREKTTLISIQNIYLLIYQFSALRNEWRKKKMRKRGGKKEGKEKEWF